MMDIYISSYRNFDSIPKNIICVGVTKNTPERFCTTKIENYLYTPRSILGGEFPSDNSISVEQFYKLFEEHLNMKIKKEYRSVQEYFAKMFSEFSIMLDGRFKGFCFLGDDEYNDADMTNVIKRLLIRLGYDVKRLRFTVAKKDDNSLF